MKSLYIHIPFCKSKCYYCDFNSYSGKDDLIEKYIEALKSELKEINCNFKTVYFGGGTPSNIPSKYIIDLMNEVQCDGEITLELNPGTITKEKLQDYKEAGSDEEIRSDTDGSKSNSSKLSVKLTIVYLLLLDPLKKYDIY